MKVPRRFLPHTVTVEPQTGSGAYGDVFGPSVPLRCMADGTRRMVRDPQGGEVVSSLTLIAEPGQADAIPPGSRVTWHDGTTRVISSTDRDDGGLGAPQHTEVVCE